MFGGPPRECGGMAECPVHRICPGQGRRSRRLAGRKSFRGAPPPPARRRALDEPAHAPRPGRKVLRSLTRAGSGAIRRTCFRTHVCVIDGRFARREQANGATGRGRRMERRDRFGLRPKQTRAQSGGAAGERRARETGKPGCRAQRRGEAAWPNARRTEGPFSPATRAAERGRPSGSERFGPIDAIRV